VAKGPDAFRTISEAADEVGVPQHVLRFWETKFTFVRPMKRAGGRRFYRPQDIVVLKGVRALLHEDGYTIRGVQQLYRDSGAQRILAAGSRPPGRAGRIASQEDMGMGEIEAEAAEAVAEAIRPEPSRGEGGSHAELIAELEAARARLDAVLRRR
jgi:DNA-binding transcriptional MerR regulator